MAASLTDEFLNEWKTSVNPDLQKERDTCTFNKQELTHILDGGAKKTKRRKELENFIFTKYGDLFSYKSRPFLSKSETYEASVAKSVKLFQLRKELNMSEEEYDMVMTLLNQDFALSLHHTMFIPAIERMATDEQKAKWLPLAQSYKILGTYAQTELGHGTNLLGLETTATFDPDTDEFVLNTPHLSSMKWWPGGLAKSMTHAVVLAHLVVGGKKCGMNAFIVQLRSLEDHTPLPGRKLGDIGPKLGGNNIDNGYLILTDVRIPRLNMLMRNAVVTKDGKFKELAANMKINYATMVLVRVKIVQWCGETLRQAAIVSIRYSAVRRQTTLKPGTPEQQVLDFQTQQYKTFPALAAAYADLFVARDMMATYQAAYAEIMKGNTRKLAELHAQTSGFKAFLSDQSTQLVEMCRRSCGGHGFLMSSVIAENMATSLALITIEGENTVLYLQTARYIMKQIANAVSGRPTEGATAYMNRDWSSYSCPLMAPEDCHSLDKLVEVYVQRALKVVMKVAQKLQMDMESGEPQEVVFNNNMVSLVRAARAHIHLSVTESFICNIQKLVPTCSASLAKVLTDLCAFHTIHGIVTEAGDFLEMETMGLEQIDWLRQAEQKLLAVIRPNAVGLVDAFDLHDETVASTLGMYDGNAYQHLYESTQLEPLNKSDVHSSYYKYIRPLLKGSSKL